LLFRCFHFIFIFESIKELGSALYKITLGIVTIALGRLDDIHVRVGNVVCNMVFLVVDTDTYDLLLGLDFFMKIRAVVDVEKDTI
jgi:hypothetical protein